MIHLDLKVNLRWLLRIICWMREEGHQWLQVSAGDAWSRSYRYCRLCGYGWRLQGLKACRLRWQHHWRDEGSPSETRLEDDTGAVVWVPFRQLQRCQRCRKSRVIDCDTRQVVH